MVEKNMPTHIGIIMDGNRRWAKSHNLPVKLGHREGAKTLEKIVKYAKNIGVKYITVYAFSTENWKRGEDEVNSLMTLLKNYLDEYSKKADTDNIKIRVFGDESAFNEGLQKSINDAIERTKDNTGISFNICLNYGGRAEIIEGAKKIAEQVKNGELNIKDINEEVFEKSLYSGDVPDPDLMIRTSGEFRISGFMLWKMAYTEFIFLEKYWPDFNEKDLDECIVTYKNRNRRLGK